MNSSLYPHFGVLLVDDEPAWLRSLRLTLERSAGITNIITCQDSRTVMELLDQHEIGLVLLDLTMPNLSGDQLIGLIAESHPEIAVIVISGMNQIESAVNCIKQEPSIILSRRSRRIGSSAAYYERYGCWNWSGRIARCPVECCREN